MTLDHLISELFSVVGVEGVDYRTLPKNDQLRLVEAYMLEDCSELQEVIARLPGAPLMFSSLAGPGEADLFSFRCMFQNTASGYYADHIQGQIDGLWRDYCDSNGIFGHYDMDPPELIGFKEDAA